ncbi:hypothetical protein N0V93_002092 [Gnomoniopsis smithogilvyi]|uniref:Cutinase n=1 Tax=Gnomoniopsis smithogilvyi TaxID=1191159 RepID=A0A9W8Z538_9PEZI|nr:hypothetical protein N0V93_002092 [Gnomoniopsis smithogilvyi]
MASLILLTGILAATAAAQNSTTSACVNGTAVHMIVARASLEKPGPGVIGGVATQVVQQLPGSDIVSVDYPATLENYTSSEAAGVKAMTTLLTDYASRCPNSKIVMMGYSQGAQVAADVLCGTNEGSLFQSTQAMNSSILDKVAAVVLMGDPSKAQNETFINGTSTKNGIFPRQNVNGCSSIEKRMVSYCNANDTFCDSGSSIQVHLSYVQNNGTAAMNFILSQANSNAGGSTGGNGNGNPTVSVSSGSLFRGLGNGATALIMLGLGFIL